MLSVALFLFLRGHNLPGGGFSAGLVAAIGVLLLYLARGTDWVDARARHPDQQRVVGAGLLVATVTGAREPRVRASVPHQHVPGAVGARVGKVPLASALVFDLGVLLTVAGATLLGVVALGRLGRPAAPPQGRPA